MPFRAHVIHLLLSLVASFRWYVAYRRLNQLKTALESVVLVQVWLTLNNLVVDPHFRSKYKLDGFRKDTVCRIRRFLNDLLIDQLPVLKDLQRVVDEISLNYTPDFNEFESGSLVIEQVLPDSFNHRHCFTNQL